MLRLVFLTASLFLTACATTPLQPFPPTHPASPEAAEASAGPPPDRLASDTATRHTVELLAAETKPVPKPGMEMNAPQPAGGSHENH